MNYNIWTIKFIKYGPNLLVWVWRKDYTLFENAARIEHEGHIFATLNWAGDRSLLEWGANGLRGPRWLRALGCSPWAGISWANKIPLKIINEPSFLTCDKWSGSAWQWHHFWWTGFRSWVQENWSHWNGTLSGISRVNSNNSNDGS